MSTWSIIAIAVSGAVIVLPWVIELVCVLLMKKSARMSASYLCSHLRHLVYVIGQIRSGKSTFMAGYATIRTEGLIEAAKAKIRFICRAFPTVPFDCIENRLLEDFKAGDIDSYAEARKLVANGQILADYRDLEYDNKLSNRKTPFINMLNDYIDARWALMRNNYVYYYGKGYHSWITGNDAMDYTPEMLAIKDIYIAMNSKDEEGKQGTETDYHILPYSIICEDEKQLSGKDCTQFMSYAKADSGTADFMRLIGQIGKETIYYVTTNQNFGTDMLRERQLATEIVYMNKSVAVNPRFMTMTVIRIAEIPARIALWWKARKDSDVPSSLMVTSKPRSYLAKTAALKKSIAANGYVKFYGSIYHNANDVGKRKGSTLDPVDRLRAVVPIRYARGSISTFEFNAIQRALISKSKWKLSDEPQAITDDALAVKALTKRRNRERKQDKA